MHDGCRRTSKRNCAQKNEGAEEPVEGRMVVVGVEKHVRKRTRGRGGSEGQNGGG